jgi:hypothetical protein
MTNVNLGGLDFSNASVEGAQLQRPEAKARHSLQPLGSRQFRRPSPSDLFSSAQKQPQAYVWNCLKLLGLREHLCGDPPRSDAKHRSLHSSPHPQVSESRK